MKASLIVKGRGDVFPPPRVVRGLGHKVVERSVVHPATLAAPAHEDEAVPEGHGRSVKGTGHPCWHGGPLPPLHVAEREDFHRRVNVAPS